MDNNSKKAGLFFTAAALSLLAQLGPSDAATVTFNFNSPQADSASYTFTDLGTGLVLTVSPGTFIGNTITNQGLMTLTAAGLGVQSPADGEPLIDASGLNDLAKFSFSGVVTLSDITFNNTDTHDSFRFFHDSDNNNTLVDNGTFNDPNHSSGLVHLGSLFPTLVTGELFAFGSLQNLACGNPCNNNEWRIGSLKLNYQPPGEGVGDVPVPAALPLLATGLGGMAWLSRRRKRKLSQEG